MARKIACIVCFVSLFQIAPCLLAQDGGQSLADIARKEQERKKNEAPPKTVFTGEAGTTYIGCYEDKFFSQDRDLQGDTFKSMAMTNDVCQAHCQAKGFKYASTEGGNECWCGNSYGKYAHLPESKCGTVCAGKSQEKCGGNFAGSVFSLGVGTASGPTASGPSGAQGNSDSSAGSAGSSKLTGQASGEKATFSVTVSAPKSSVKMGTAVWVSYEVTNVSDHKIRVASFANDVQFEIENGQGQRVSYAKHKDRNGRMVMATSGPTGGGMMTDLEPGKTVKGQLPISQYYDLSRPGQYTVQVSRKNPDSNEVRMSNQISVTITP